MTLTREDFIRLCVANPELKLERTAQGELILMAPTGGETGNLNFEISGELYVWNRQTSLGKSFDSSQDTGVYKQWLSVGVVVGSEGEVSHDLPCRPSARAARGSAAALGRGGIARIHLADSKNLVILRSC